MTRSGRKLTGARQCPLGDLAAHTDQINSIVPIRWTAVVPLRIPGEVLDGISGIEMTQVIAIQQEQRSGLKTNQGFVRMATRLIRQKHHTPEARSRSFWDNFASLEGVK